MESGRVGMIMGLKWLFGYIKMENRLATGSLMMKKVNGCVKNNIKKVSPMEYGLSLMTTKIKFFNTILREN